MCRFEQYVFKNVTMNSLKEMLSSELRSMTAKNRSPSAPGRFEYYIGQVRRQSYLEEDAFRYFLRFRVLRGLIIAADSVSSGSAVMLIVLTFLS